MVGLGLFLASVPDPRAGNARHDLSEVLFIAFAAMLCGAETCVDMAEFGAAKQEVLCRVLALEHGVPSHDTFSRVFRLLDPHRFEAGFRAFMARFAARLSGTFGTAGQTLALDGKSLCGAVDPQRPTQPLHLVSVWAAEQRLVLGLTRAEGRSEPAAAREIVALLDLTATTVTADALHANRQTAAAIRARGGDYALALKGNRVPLHRDAAAVLSEPGANPVAVSTEMSHGRHEERWAWVTAAPPDRAIRYGFQDLAAVARVDAHRRIGTVGASDRCASFAPYHLYQLALAGRPHSFRRMTSWSISLSSDRSATKHYSLAFSSSNCFSRHISVGSNPEYFFFQLK